jgi:hypothetical protein
VLSVCVRACARTCVCARAHARGRVRDIYMFEEDNGKRMDLK